MKPERYAELRALQAHEEWISRPVKELFKDTIAKGRTGICRHCGISFIASGKCNKTKCYCSTNCKDAFVRRLKKRRAA